MSTNFLKNMKNKNGVVSDIFKNSLARSIKDPSIVNLNTKVDLIIDWYELVMVNGQYTRIGEYSKPKELRNFIEKIAVWYEMRYPDYEINRIMPGSSCDNKDIDEIMFKDNRNNQIWEDVLSAHSFITSLPWEEKYLLKKPSYPEIAYLDDYYDAHFHLTRNGFITEAEGIEVFTNNNVSSLELENMNIRDAVSILREKGYKLNNKSEVIRSIDSVLNQTFLKEELLNASMYRIIERGGNRFGPRRAYLFAKDFSLNKDIPMRYGVDLSDPGLRLFMVEYLKNGGSEDLECVLNYFQKDNDNYKFEFTTVKSLMKNCSHRPDDFYTPYEKELQKRLTYALSNKLNKENVKTRVRS